MNEPPTHMTRLVPDETAVIRRAEHQEVIIILINGQQLFPEIILNPGDVLYYETAFPVKVPLKPDA